MATETGAREQLLEELLRQLYGLVKEYDYELDAEEAAQDIDSRTGTNTEWPRVLGIFAGVKAALGAQS